MDSLLIFGGSNFSGGERQRLAIARALAKKPDLLLVDDAFSALDAHTALELRERLKTIKCTAIIVSHRISALADCDNIYVMDKGCIIQSGKHEDLKNQSGLYKNIFDLQKDIENEEYQNENHIR
jgi:ABC-type multidrug transport system fused ATPase/permease subunit